MRTVLLVVLYLFIARDHSLSKIETCPSDHIFSINILDTFKTLNKIGPIYDHVFSDLDGKRVVLDSYGYKFFIEKLNKCNFKMILKYKLEEGSTLSIEYDLELKRDYFQISVDTSINHYYEHTELPLDSIQHSILLKKAIHDKGGMSDPFYEYFELFKASMNGNKKALKLFSQFDKEWNGLYLGYDYYKMHRILADYGYLIHRYSKSNMPVVFERKFSYVL